MTTSHSSAQSQDHSAAHIKQALPQSTQSTECLQAKDLQDSPAWKARQHLSWFIEDNMPAKYYQFDKDPASFGLASLGPLISLEREWWASSWVGSNAWMLDQLRQSPLRVAKREAADMVILPVSFRAGAPFDELQVSDHP